MIRIKEIRCALRNIRVGTVILGALLVVTSCSDASKEKTENPTIADLPPALLTEFESFNESMRCRNLAMKTLAGPSIPSDSDEVSQEAMDLTKEFLRRGIAACESVTDPTLAGMHKDMPYQYRQHFEQGMKTLLAGLEAMNGADMLMGQQLCDDFGNWYISTFKSPR